MKVRKKPLIIDARGPLADSEVILTAHGRVRAEPGDYVLSDPRSGDTWPIKPDIFADTYDVIPEEDESVASSHLTGRSHAGKERGCE